MTTAEVMDMARREARGGRVMEVGVSLPHLQEWRMRKLMKQVELAEAAGVSRSTIASAERGSRIAAGTAEKIAAALGATVDELQHAPAEE